MSAKIYRNAGPCVETTRRATPGSARPGRRRPAGACIPRARYDEGYSRAASRTRQTRFPHRECWVGQAPRVTHLWVISPIADARGRLATVSNRAHTPRRALASGLHVCRQTQHNGGNDDERASVSDRIHARNATLPRVYPGMSSLFGPEYRATGMFTVVGPSPIKRVWYATVTMQDDLIVSVK